MKLALLAVLMAGPLLGAYSVVQSVNCDNTTSPLTCTLPGDATAGNFLVIMTAKRGGDTCNMPSATVFSDSLGSTFNYAWSAENPNTAQSNSCIKFARLAASGAETVTRTEPMPDAANYPAAMWVVEITGGAAYRGATNGATCDAPCVSIDTGNVATTSSNALLACVSADYFGNAFDSVSPSGGTYYVWTDAAGTGSFAVKPVGAGTYSCTFGKTLGGVRLSAAAVLISSSGGMFPLPSPIGRE